MLKPDRTDPERPDATAAADAELAQAEQGGAAGERPRPRGRVVAAVLVPVIGLAVLLVWGVARSPGGVARDRLAGAGQGELRDRLAPDFTIQTFDHGELTLSDLRGNVVLVDFWGSWCPPCRREAGTIASVYAQYAEQGLPVEFVGIDVWDTEEAARGHIEEFGITYPNGPDSTEGISTAYEAWDIPLKVFIDREGLIRRQWLGPISEQALVSIIDGLLAE